MVPGSWFMVHGAWIMDHGAIPWVLLALDPGAQDHGSLVHGSCCPGAWFMHQYPGFWLHLEPGSLVQGSLVYSQE